MHTLSGSTGDCRKPPALMRSDKQRSRRGVQQTRATCRRGLVVIDVVMGTVILLTLFVIFGLAIRGRATAMAHSADTRAAARLAERTLYFLHEGLPATAAQPGEKVTVTPLNDPPPALGLGWTRVTAVSGGRTATLIGLIATHREQK